GVAGETYAKEPLKSMVVGELLPGAGVTSDAALKEHVLATASTTQHPCGTCKMGNDAMAVGDDKPRVLGLARLRVDDASVMPTIPGGHINAPTIMIGEKAADMIRGRALAPAVCVLREQPAHDEA